MMDIMTIATVIMWIALYMIILVAAMATIRGIAYIRDAYYTHWQYVVFNIKKRGIDRKIRRLEAEKDALLSKDTFNIKDTRQALDIKDEIEALINERKKYEYVVEEPKFEVTLDTIDLSVEIMERITMVIEDEYNSVIMNELIVLKEGDRLDVTKYDEYVKTIATRVFKALRPEVFDSNTIYSKDYLMQYIMRTIGRMLTELISRVNQTQ